MHRKVWTSPAKPGGCKIQQHLVMFQKERLGLWEWGDMWRDLCESVPKLEKPTISQVEEARWFQGDEDKPNQIYRCSLLVNCLGKEKRSKSKLEQPICICHKKKKKKLGVRVLTAPLAGCVILSRSPSRLAPPRTSVFGWWEQGWMKTKTILPHKALWGLTSFQRINVKVF